MDLNDTIKRCAQKCSIGTYLFTTIDKANVIIDAVDKYPLMLRFFGETATTTSDGLYGSIEHNLTLYFYETLGKLDADVETEIAPLADRMLSKAVEFVDTLQDMGIDIKDRPQFQTSRVQFDAILVGYRCDLTVIFNANCEKYANNIRDCR